MHVSNTELQFLIDSGSSLDILHGNAYKQLKPQPVLQSNKTKILPYQGSVPAPVHGSFKATLSRAGKFHMSTIYIIKGSIDSLLSKTSSQKLDLLSELDRHLLPNSSHP